MLTQRQRDPVPHALRPSKPSDSAPQAPETSAPKDAEQTFSSDSGNPGMAIAEPPSSAQPPLIYIDPAMRTPQQHGSIAPIVPGPAPQEQQAAQQQLGSRPATDGLGLLIEAFDTHQSGGTIVTRGPADQGQGPAALLGHQPEYYAQPGVAGNDGYENELQFYIDGPPNMQGWVGNGGGMYGY